LGGSPNQASDQQPIEGALGGTGLFDIPVLGGLLRDAVSSTESFGRMAGEGIGDIGRSAAYGIDKLSGDPNADKNLIAQKSMFLNPKTNSGDAKLMSGDLRQVGSEALGRTANFGMTAEGLKGLPQLAKGIPSLPKYLIPSKTAQGITDVTASATGQGARDVWGDLKTELRQEVAGRFGNSPEYTKALENRLKTFEDLSMNPKTGQATRGPLTPTKLIQLRRQASGRLKSASGKLSVGSPQDKVDEVIRDITSKRAKAITPGLAPLDRAYSMQKRFYPEIKKHGLQAVGLGAGAGVVGDFLNQLHEAVNSNQQN
jgi:hypothetical protein